MDLKEKEVPCRIFEIFSFCGYQINLAGKKNELYLCKLWLSREFAYEEVWACGMLQADG